MSWLVATVAAMTDKPNANNEYVGRKVGGFMFSFLRAWLAMLALGAIASQTGWPTAIGYWTTWLVIFVVRAVFSGISVDVSSIFGLQPTSKGKRSITNPRLN
jgi:hypothetical protein